MITAVKNRKKDTEKLNNDLYQTTVLFMELALSKQKSETEKEHLVRVK